MLHAMLQYPELMEACIEQRGLTDAAIEEAFQLLDADGSGVITAENISLMLSSDQDDQLACVADSRRVRLMRAPVRSSYSLPLALSAA